MKTKLSDAGRELFHHLTSSTFYVVDCEYTATGDGSGSNSIISIAIVPVIHGRRAAVTEEHYFVMNPGVAISTSSTQIHGFTDASVKGKRDFAHYAPSIIAALDEHSAIFVSHTSADLLSLRAELIHLDARKAQGETISVGLADLPELQVIDTSTLARTVRYEGIGQSGVISLVKLCELTGVVNKNAHDARSDARATADCLIELLAHASQKLGKSDLNELLREHKAVTTHKPRVVISFHGRQEFDPELPPEHIAKHLEPLDHVANKNEISEWVDLAEECAGLRCQWLVDEATVAGNFNAPVLLDLLTELLPSLTQPGQAATLLAAIAELIKYAQRDGEPGLSQKRSIRWWGKVRPLINVSPVCGSSNSQKCPACRMGGTCSRDTIYQLVSQIALLGKNTTFTDGRARELFTAHGDVGLFAWNKRYPEIAAYSAWYVIAMEQDEMKASLAANNLTTAIEMGLHLVEPRLTLLAAEMLNLSQQPKEAIKICKQMLKGRTSDEGYDALDQWMLVVQHLLKVKTQTAPKAPSKHPRLARPNGRTNFNPYAITESADRND